MKICGQKKAECQKVISESWNGFSICSCEDLAQTVQRCGNRLANWNKHYFGNLQYRIKQKKLEIEDLQRNVYSMVDSLALEEGRKKLEELTQKEEILWRQRSKCLWLKEGDRNTTYFHAMASARRRNNRVQGIMAEDSSWKEKEAEVTKVFLNYFSSIFTSSKPTNMELVYEAVEKRILMEMNDTLVKDFTKEKI